MFGIVFLVLVIVASNIVDAVIGDPYSFPHPVIYMGKLISRLEKNIRHICDKLDVHRSIFMRLGGLFIWVVLCASSFVFTYFVTEVPTMAYSIHKSPYLFVAIFFVNTVVLWTTVSTRCLYNESMKVYRALRDNDIDSARLYLSYIVGRQTQDLGESEIIRAAVETVAENTVDGTISPLFYAYLGGAKLAMMYKAVNTMDSMLGYKNEKYIDIGRYPARLDDVFNFVPARFSVIPFTLAAIVLGYDYRSAFRIAIRDRKNHTSPNCAFSEGAVAGALGIELGGSNVYFGELVEKPTIGTKKRELEYEDIKRANMMMAMASVFSIAIFSAVFAIIYYCV